MPQFMPQGGFGGGMGGMSPNIWMQIMHRAGKGLLAMGQMGSGQGVNTQGDKSGLLGMAKLGQGMGNTMGMPQPQPAAPSPPMNPMPNRNWSLLANPAQGAALSAELPTPQQVMQRPADHSLMPGGSGPMDGSLMPLRQLILQQQQPGFRGEHPMMPGGGK